MKQATIIERAREIFPGGVNSPVRAFSHLPVVPLMIEKGREDKIYDVTAASFIDYCMSWGALLFGHAHKNVVEAVQRQMEKGSSYGLTSPLEEKLGRKIIKHMPSIEKIRFVSSGTEATMSALRLARAYTGKNTFIKFDGNYHGHADPFLVKAGSSVSSLPNASSAGIPKSFIEHTLSLPYNDAEAVKAAFANDSTIGAVIVEPIAANMGVVPASKHFLQTLREETTKAGALLLFDEVITGFRVGLGGAQELYGIKPDLTALGKIVGGGLPAAAFGGRKEIMDLLAPIGPVYQAGTLSGNPLAMAAGLATLEMAESLDVYETLASKTAALLAPIQRVIYEKALPVTINQVGSMFTLFFGARKVTGQTDLLDLDPKEYARFYKHLFTRGIYFSPAQMEACFLSVAHLDESLEKTQEALLEFFRG